MDLEEARSIPSFKRHDFDRNHGIIGSRRKFFRSRVIDGLHGTHQLLALDDHFINMCKMVKPHNDLLNPRFLTEYEAAYHYLKHKEIHLPFAIAINTILIYYQLLIRPI